MEVLLLVSTMTGTAEMVAEDIRDTYPDHQMTIRLVEHSTPADLSKIRHLLLLSSTYGQGEVPEPSKPFFNALQNDRLDLSHIQYGVVALGDTIYPDTFANGGRLWDKLLSECGAKRLTDMLVFDASAAEDMAALAVAWAAKWMDAAQPGPG